MKIDLDMSEGDLADAVHDQLIRMSIAMPVDHILDVVRALVAVAAANHPVAPLRKKARK